jgi:hypothetical protein
MADSEADATTARDKETVLRSPAGFAPPTAAELVARFPNLEGMELLGHRGTGIVYKGRQPFLDRLVAIKVIRPDLQTDDAFQERSLREARTLAKLRHPFIVTVFDVCKAGNLYGLAMERASDERPLPGPAGAGFVGAEGVNPTGIGPLRPAPSRP